MAFDAGVTNDEGYIGEVLRFKQGQHISMKKWLRDLNSNIQHPNVIETQFAVITSEDVQLTFNNVRSMSASWPWSVITSLDFLP